MVISVLVEISFNNKEKTFDYLVPKDLEDKIEIGKRVLVPFGKQNLEGFIIDIKKNSEYDLKEITSIIDEEPILNEELLNLGKELKKDLVCNLISIYQAMLPSGYKASAKTNINVKKEKYVKLANIKEAQEFITTSKAQKQIEVVEDLLKNKISLKSKYQSNIIKVLKDKGYWIIGTDMNGTSYNDMKYDMPICLVIGNEGKGMSRLVKESCDYVVSIDMVGKTNSLNASVATGIMMAKIQNSRKL